jgi:Spy/CpxP family protein refolding chaperone
MKVSLKVLFTALALGVMASVPALHAQDDKAPPAEGRKGGKGGGRGMSADAMVSRLDEAVTLTADQKTNVHDIYAKLFTDTQALPREDMRTKGGELRDAAHKQIRALLTEDQQKKFDAMPPPGRGGRKKKDN